jgi:hypothetical protein
MLTGSADVFRGAERLGTVVYDFHIDPHGRVTGSVTEISHAELRHASAPRVPPSFLPATPGVGRDLSITLPDDRVVRFMVRSTAGDIVNAVID